jgi:hypothetical protein
VTIRIISSATKFIGLSTDPKPLLRDRIGSTFYETDTKKTKLWTGTEWVDDLRGGSAPNSSIFEWNPSDLNFYEMIGFFSWADLPGLTSLTFLGTTSIAGFDLEGIEALTSISFPNLVSIDPDDIQGGYLTLTGNTSLTTVDAAALVSIGGSVSFTDNPSLAGLDLSALASVGMALSVYSNPSLINLNLSALASVGRGMNVSINASIISLDLSALASVGGNLEVSQNPSLTSLDISALESVGTNLFIYDNPSLIGLNLPAFLQTNGNNMLFSGNALSSGSVNQILALFVANPEFVSGSIDLSGGTNALPTGQGLSDVDTLRARGVSIQLNS